jgi:two-component system, NtrC family, nitrogen regulation response regulator NtrX
MLNVLIVDDNAGIRDLNAKLLRQLDCNVTEVSDSAQALKLVEQENPFDVIFVDFRMPYMNGLELFERIRTLHPDAAVVLTSVSPNIETQALAQVKGLADYIFGYTDRGRFKAALDKALNR